MKKLSNRKLEDIKNFALELVVSNDTKIFINASGKEANLEWLKQRFNDLFTGNDGEFTEEDKEAYCPYCEEFECYLTCKRGIEFLELAIKEKWVDGEEVGYRKQN